MRAFFRRLQYLVRGRRMEAELREELEFHRALAQQRLERDGVAADAAAAASRRVMGNVTLAREDARAAWVLPWIDSFRQDAAYAWRQLARQPGFAVLAVGTLAAAIGLNTSLFTVFSAMAIRPWPVSDPERVVNLFNMSSRDLRGRKAGGPRGFSLDEAGYFQSHAKTITGVVATRTGGGDQTLGNLLIARAVARRREIAVRLSLGASRARVIRQLLTEGVVLAAASALMGLWIAYWFPKYLVTMIAGSAALQLTPDSTVLAFTGGVSVLSCIAFALAPAVHGTRIGVAGALKEGTPLTSARFRLRSALLAIQTAAVVVLLCGAGLLVRAIGHAASQDFGFDIAGLSVASTEAPPRGFDAARTHAVALQMAADLEFLDGTRVALTSTTPLGSGNIKGSFTIPGNPEAQGNSVYEVSPGYFSLTGTRLIAGRLFTAADAGQPVIVVNETMARRYWTVEDAVGRVVVCEGLGAGWNRQGQLEIIGVVNDVYITSTTSVGSTIYQPLSGRSLPHVLFRRSDADAASVAAGAATRIDRRLRTRMKPLAENLEPLLRASRTAAVLAAALGALALLLGSVGLFGVFACWVQQRTHEIGIRMALGAGAVNVIALVLRSSGGALAAGLILGAAGTAAASRLLESYLMGLSPMDPVAYLAVAMVLAVAGAVATYIPARRATRVDPLRALRCD